MSVLVGLLLIAGVSSFCDSQIDGLCNSFSVVNYIFQSIIIVTIFICININISVGVVSSSHLVDIGPAAVVAVLFSTSEVVYSFVTIHNKQPIEYRLDIPSIAVVTVVIGAVAHEHKRTIPLSNRTLLKWHRVVFHVRLLHVYD